LGLKGGDDLENDVGFMVAHTGQTSPSQVTQARPAGLPFISVAICTRNRAPLLEKAAHSVLAQLTAATDLLIVDNASTDDTYDRAAALAASNPSVTVYRESQLGLSAARNTALQVARGDYVVFLDDDAVAEPGWLAAYQSFLAAPPSESIAVVGGAVFPCYEAPPPKWLGAGSGELNLGAVAKRVSAHGGPWGGNSAYRRDAVMRIGLFDTRLGRKGASLGAHEECELNQRLQDAGYEVWWLPQARIQHLVPAVRVRLGWSLRSQFSLGRSTAIMRLRRMPGTLHRIRYRMVRLLLAPFHCAAHLLLALVCFPFQHGRLAVVALMHAARIAGMARELAAGWLRPPPAVEGRQP
jgi:GT2 family glycosyltransferase